MRDAVKKSRVFRDYYKPMNDAGMGYTFAEESEFSESGAGELPSTARPSPGRGPRFRAGGVVQAYSICSERAVRDGIGRRNDREAQHFIPVRGFEAF